MIDFLCSARSALYCGRFLGVEKKKKRMEALSRFAYEA